ncbi:50S ribosome-binding protein YggL [Balneatrix alpica]|uniref:50S ribosome-binding protein YggL n=1 Tax=Balneatrix alpica TaxID=75684 RepID=A0ABV5ZCB4_9GAMM|nr:50S ribosome-binding protein YggL [Balneatrix alpica]
MPTKRKRRLRKKLYLEEFAIFGFEFTCQSTVSRDEDDSFLDVFLEFTDSLHLICAVGFSPDTFSGFLCSEFRYGSPTNEDRVTVKAWLEAQAGITNVHIGELVDANYGV